MSTETVIHSFAYNLNFLREQVADVASSDMVMQPNGIKNHPSWVLGHLTFSCQAIGGEIGLNPWLPESWSAEFGTGSCPIPDSSSYPVKQQALELLLAAEHKVIGAVEKLTDHQLDQPLPDEGFREILPTVRHAVTQILVAHTANHVGQMTLWRQAMNLQRISRPFL